ncbi:hypothetical protein K445DRAFT_304542 [Daldinia sp. EC12]|nr:hypothetical protein K445DRAFT_304542 [Daldinia sp. EC12]
MMGAYLYRLYRAFLVDRCHSGILTPTGTGLPGQSRDSAAQELTSCLLLDLVSAASSQRGGELHYPLGPGGSSFAIFDIRSSAPVNNQEEPKDLRNNITRPAPVDVTFCITIMAPHHSSPMHCSLSLDYCAVLSGEIVLELDGSEEKIIKAGEVVVQQGVNHAWHNRTDDVCRIAFVMVGA